MSEVGNGQEAVVIANLEASGEDQVRHLFYNAGYPPTWNLVVTKWLAKKQRERRQKADEFQREMAVIAAKSLRATRLAMWLAGVAAVVSLGAWFFPVKG